MKIERISDNQIRCTLTSVDLNARDLNLGELAYGTDKAKMLFHEMIQKASREVGFEAEDIPLMVEAIPLSGESVMLIITKIEDPEELDTRFSKFSPMSEEDDTLSALASELLEGADGILDLLSGQASDVASKTAAFSAALSQLAGIESPVSNSEQTGEKQPLTRFFSFDSLDQVCSAARVAGQAYDGPSTLYKNPKNRRYYLAVHETEAGNVNFSRMCNLLSEYSAPLKADPAAEAYYQEHYEVIVRENALRTLATL